MATVHGHESRMMRAPLSFIDALSKRAKAEYKADGRGMVQVLRRLAPVLSTVKLAKIEGTEGVMKPLAPQGLKYDGYGRIKAKASKNGKKVASKAKAKKPAKAKKSNRAES